MHVRPVRKSVIKNSVINNNISQHNLHAQVLLSNKLNFIYVSSFSLCEVYVDLSVNRRFSLLSQARLEGVANLRATSPPSLSFRSLRRLLLPRSLHLLEAGPVARLGFRGLDYTNDNSKNTKSTSKDFNNQHLYEER